MWRLSTVLITRFVDAIRLDSTQRNSPLSIAEYARDEIRVLKELTWHYVIVQHELASGQRGQQRIIESLFDILVDAAHSRSQWKLFPASIQEQLQLHNRPQSIIRTVTDYIASMTEKEAVRQFQALTGSG